MYRQENGAEREDMPTAWILLVESDSDLALLLNQLISEEMGLHCLTVTTCFAALKITNVLTPSLFLLNEYLPDGDGITLYDRLHSRNDLAKVPAIIMSTLSGTCQQKVAARHLTCLGLPFDLDTFLQVIQNYLRPGQRSPLEATSEHALSQLEAGNGVSSRRDNW
ncbi:MAG TPA: response regulator [Ktedonobacteraceae bacterium]|nr:response regulator [Ktedonobacteraceae bacterium]